MYKCFPITPFPAAIAEFATKSLRKHEWEEKRPEDKISSKEGGGEH